MRIWSRFLRWPAVWVAVGLGCQTACGPAVVIGPDDDGSTADAALLDRSSADAALSDAARADLTFDRAAPPAVPALSLDLDEPAVLDVYQPSESESFKWIVNPRPLPGSLDVLVEFSYKDAPQIGHVGLFSFANRSLKCLTCNVVDQEGPYPNLRRPIPFANNCAMMQSNQDGSLIRASFKVLECSPSFQECTTAKLLPVKGVQEIDDLLVRWQFPSPDGKKLVWEAVRLPGGVTKYPGVLMMMGDLRKVRNTYLVTNAVVINPTFPPNDSDSLAHSPEAMAIRGSYIEPKGFCNGGRSLLFGASLHGALNVDMFRLDLFSGSVQRLTMSPGWDEEGSCSTNNNALVMGVQRGEHLTMAPFSAVIRPPFFDAALGTIQNYFVVGPEHTPWPRLGGERSVALFSGDGETETESGLILSKGENEKWFSGPETPIFADDNRHIFWSEVKQCTTETRLVKATLKSRISGTDVAPITPPTPQWATPLHDYPNIESDPITEIVDGQGTASIQERFDSIQQKLVSSVTYRNFPWQGVIVNGQETVTNYLGEDDYHVHLSSNISTTGAQNGLFQLDADIWDGQASGAVHTVKDGVSFPSPWENPENRCPLD